MKYMLVSIRGVPFYGNSSYFLLAHKKNSPPPKVARGEPITLRRSVEFQQ